MNGTVSTFNHISMMAIGFLIVTALAGAVGLYFKLWLCRHVLKKTVADYVPDAAQKQLLSKLIEPEAPPEK